MRARAWMAATGAALVLTTGCTGAQAPKDDALIEDNRLKLAEHPFWSADVPIAPPDAIAFDVDAEPEWVAHVISDVSYELWPGGVRVASGRERWGVRVHGLDGERVRFATQDGMFVYYPSVERDALRDFVTNQPTLVYGPDGIPFAQIQRAIQVKPAAGGVTDDRLLYVCLGGEVCWAQGYVARGSLSDVVPIKAALDTLRPPDERPEILNTISIFDDTERTLFDARGRPLASATFEYIEVLVRGGPWAEVIAHKDGVHLHGFMPADEVTVLEEGVLGGLGGLGLRGTGMGGGGAPVELLRIERGTWVYGAPASAARFARLIWDSTTLVAVGSDAQGWSAAEVQTPWGRYTVYVRDEDIVEVITP